MKKRFIDIAVLLLRLALAAAFLSAVADRLGLWGPAGTGGVEWGDLAHFNAYVAKLNWFLPASIIPSVGWAATSAESLLAIGLLVGCQLRWFALANAMLLLSFAITMIIALGTKAPLDYRFSLRRLQDFCCLSCSPNPKGPNRAMQILAMRSRLPKIR